MKYLALPLLILLSAATNAQNLKVTGTTPTFNLVAGVDYYNSIALLSYKGRNNQVMRLDFTSTSGGFIENPPYQILYSLYFTEDTTCTVSTCATQISLPMGSVFPAANSTDGELYIQVLSADVQGAASGVYTDTLTIDLIVI